MSMSRDYPYPVIIQDGKRYGLGTHISNFTGHTQTRVSDTAEANDVATIHRGFKVYFDVDAMLEALKHVRFQPRNTITEVDLGPDRQARRLKNDLFAPKVA